MSFTQLRTWLFAPTDIALLVFFRVVFGGLCVAEGIMGLFSKGKFASYENPVNFTYTFFHWVEPLPSSWLYGLNVVLILLGVFIFLGAWYRFTTWLFAVIFLYFFLLTKEYYLNHGYLFSMLCFLMILLPAHRRFSWDSYKDASLRSDTVARWQVYILPLLMGVVYVYGAIAKMQADWLLAKPLQIWLGGKGHYWLIGDLLLRPETAFFMAWGGFLLDLSAPFLLIWKRSRKYIMGAILFFHLTNVIIFKIGVFPWLSITLSLMYFSRTWPRKLLYRFRPDLSALPFLDRYVKPNLKGQYLTLSVLSLFLLYHLLMPFRHHLYRGDVNWTEEGHRFSWRMMLRSKQGSGNFKAHSAQRDSTWFVHPRKYLTKRQNRKMLTHPDMIYQFVEHLEARYADTLGITDLEVYANIKVRLNGRPFRYLIDPEVDLTKVNWHNFKHDSWITPKSEEPSKDQDDDGS